MSIIATTPLACLGSLSLFLNLLWAPLKERLEAEAKVAFLNIAEGVKAGLSEGLPGGEEVSC